MYFLIKKILFFSLIFYSYYSLAKIDEALIDAIKTADTAAIRININLRSLSMVSRNSEKQTVFHIAVLEAQTKSLEALVSVSKLRENRYKEFLSDLINSKDQKGQTALFIATSRLDYEMMEILLQNGADPNIKPSSEKSLTLIALKANRFDLFNLLANHGASIKEELSSKKLTKLLCCLDVNILKTLIKKGLDVNLADDTNSSLLNEASARGLISQASFFLKNGANPNHLDSFFRSPLYRAIVSSNNLQLVKLLVKHKADVKEAGDYFEGDKDSLVHLAAENGQTQIMNYLIDQGALINTQNRYGKTPLMLAIESHHLESAKSLIKKGANLNIKDLSGKTAFFYSLRAGVSFAELLIDKGIDFFVKDKKGKTAFDYLGKNKSEKIKSILLKRQSMENFIDQKMKELSEALKKRRAKIKK